jgi:hypothetical protein
MIDAPTGEPRWLLELLGVIRARPGMFLGDEAVRSLDTFIAGFRAALVYCGRPDDGAASLLTAFGTWLAAKYGEPDAVGWVHLIETRFQSHPELWPSQTRRSASTLDGSIQLFFLEFDEFLGGRGVALPEGTKFFGQFFAPIAGSAEHA